MSLTVGLGFASLRVLLGLMGIGYSLLKADFSKDANEATLTNEILKAIIGQATGGIVYDSFKSGSASALEEMARLLQQGDSGILNYDLQRAARKAQLTATLLAVRACLEETRRLNANEKSFWTKTSEVIWKDKDEKWLSELAKLWQQKIDGLPKEAPPQVIKRDQIINLFDPKLNLAPTDIQRKLVEKLKDDALKEIREERYSVSPLPKAAYQLVKEAIEDGWNEFPEDTAYLTSLNLPKSLYRPEQKSALINTDKQYDWFSLVCGFFNEEYKTNERVNKAMQKYLLLDIRDKQGNVIKTKDGKPVAADVLFGHLERFSDSFVRLENLLTKVDEKQDDILGFVKNFIEENRRFHQKTHRKLDRLDEKTTQIERRLDDIYKYTQESADEKRKKKIRMLEKDIRFMKSVDELIELVAENPEIRDKVIHKLVSGVIGPRKRKSHTERHNIYYVLGEIGGEKAKSAIQQGLQESDEWARRGAERALKTINKLSGKVRNQDSH